MVKENFYIIHIFVSKVQNVVTAFVKIIQNHKKYIHQENVDLMIIIIQIKKIIKIEIIHVKEDNILNKYFI